VKRPSIGAILLGLIPFAATCFSVSLWDRIYPMVLGLPFNFFWLISWLLLTVVRKNSIRAHKRMEMLSFTSLVFSLPACRNPGASCDPITIFLVRSAFLRTWVCAMLDHVSSCPLGFTLARLLRPSRWSLDPGRTLFPRSNPPSAERGECGDPVPPEAVGLLPRAPSPSATAYRLRPILPRLLVTVV
jgi:hypothetical protein